MSDLQGAMDFRSTRTKILQGYVGLTSGSSLTLPTYPGVWTVISEVHLTLRATDGHYYVVYFGIEGPGFTACPFTSIELETSETDARLSWFGNVNLDDTMTAYYNMTPFGATATALFCGYFIPSEGPS